MDVPVTKGTGQLLLGYGQAFGKELESIQLDLSVVSQASRSRFDPGAGSLLSTAISLCGSSADLFGTRSRVSAMLVEAGGLGRKVHKCGFSCSTSF